MGLYFSWGNIEGHPEGSGYDFSQEVYDNTPGATIAADLTLEQDAARASLGAPWRMPTADEFQELIDNCSSVVFTLNGVNGLLFTSNLNGATLFFPSAGYYNGTSLNQSGSSGFYWTTVFNSATNASAFRFSGSDINSRGNHHRSLGFPVRAVMDPT